MTRTVRFYKTSSHEWFADLPEWTGEQWELEMVMGADALLDIISEGKGEVNVTFSTEASVYKWKLIRTEPQGDGYTYFAFSPLLQLNIWLCHVTETVFGGFPETIYIL